MSISDTTKYIVYDDDLIGLTIVVFPATITHAVMATCLGARDKVQSAGFLKCEPTTGAPSCYGESISLKKQSNPDRDSRLADRLLFGF